MDRRAEVRRWLALRKREGLTYRELSVRVGVPANTLCQWAWRFRHESAQPAAEEPAFVQLTSAASLDTSSSQRVEIVLRSKRRLIVDAGMDSAVLTRLLTAIEQC